MKSPTSLSRNPVAKHLYKTNRPSVEPNKKRQKLSNTLACLGEEKLSEVFNAR